MKNKIAVKLIAVLAAATTAFGAATVSASARYNNSTTTQVEAFTTAYQTFWVQSEMQKFPAGKYWNNTLNPDTYTNSGCTVHNHNDPSCGRVYNGIQFIAGTNMLLKYRNSNFMFQCAGFARKLALDFFGNGNGVSSGGVWLATECLPNRVSLRVGDQLRFQTGPSNGHSVFITEVNGNDVKFADCNAYGTCQIRWNVSGTINNDENKIYVDGIGYPLMFYFRPALAGDINGDSLVTWSDIVAIRQIANPSTYGQYSYNNVNRDYAKEAADLNNDGKVTMADANLAYSQYISTSLLVLPNQKFLTNCNLTSASNNIYYL